MTFEDIESSIQNTLLVEKYRPSKLEDVLMGDTLMSKKFEEYLSDKEIPNLIFSSRSPGTGKSTVARILSYGISSTVLKLNASLNRGIDTIRRDVEGFCMTVSMHGDYKVVLFEEFDNITYDAQKALLDLMENYSEDVRFVLTCNYINKVIDPIQSRSQVYTFGDVPQIKILKRMFEILKRENISFDKKNVAEIVKYYKSDIRSILQAIQKYTIRTDNGRELSTFTTVEDTFKDLFKMLQEKNLNGIRILIGESSVDGDDVLRYIFKNIKDLSKTKWPDICYELCEGMYRMKVGVDKDIGLISTLYSIMQIL